jgi:uncharacterized protein (DUF2164 family)
MRKKDNKKIELTKAQSERAREKLKTYFEDNFEMEIGNLRTDIFLDFISEEIGLYYYNKGIADASQYMEDRASDMLLLLMDEM